MTRRGWVRAEGSGLEVGEEGARPGEGDAESSESEAGKGDGATGGVDLAGLAVKSVWGVCRFVSTLISTLEFKVENEILTLICRFSVQLDSRVHLPVEVGARLDWGLGGEDDLPPLG